MVLGQTEKVRAGSEVQIEDSDFTVVSLIPAGFRLCKWSWREGVFRRRKFLPE